MSNHNFQNESEPLSREQSVRLIELAAKAIFEKSGPILFGGRTRIADLTEFQKQTLFHLAGAAVSTTLAADRRIGEGQELGEVDIPPLVPLCEEYHQGKPVASASGDTQPRLKGEALPVAPILYGVTPFWGSKN